MACGMAARNTQRLQGVRNERTRNRNLHHFSDCTDFLCHFEMVFGPSGTDGDAEKSNDAAIPLDLVLNIVTFPSIGALCGVLMLDFLVFDLLQLGPYFRVLNADIKADR
jgi:hypothetical protein